MWWGMLGIPTTNNESLELKCLWAWKPRDIPSFEKAHKGGKSRFCVFDGNKDDGSLT